MSSMPGSGVDGIAACGVDAETRCIGRIRDSAVEAEVLDEPEEVEGAVLDEPDKVEGAEGPGDESLFTIWLIL